MTAKPRPLTERRRRFVEAFLACGVASEAARRAGYSAHRVEVTASRLLANAEVRAEIARRRETELAAGRGDVADREERIGILSRFVRDEGMDPKHRLKAMELLSKMNGEFLQRVETSQDVRLLSATVHVSAEEATAQLREIRARALGRGREEDHVEAAVVLARGQGEGEAGVIECAGEQGGGSDA